jgi:hypothetical protein
MMLFIEMPGSSNIVVVAHAMQKLFSRLTDLTEIYLIIVGWAELRASFFTELNIIEPCPRSRRINM